MNRWLTLILMIGCCATLAGQWTFYVSYQKEGEMPHRIYLQGYTVYISLRSLPPPGQAKQVRPLNVRVRVS